MPGAEMTPPPMAAQIPSDEPDDGPVIGLADLLGWLGEQKRLIFSVTGIAAVVSLVVAFLLPPIYTARTTLLAPASQQQGPSSSAIAALGALGGLAPSGLGGRSPDELYVALLKSDSVLRALADRFDLKAHYDVATYETLRKVMPNYVRVTSDKKSGVISVEVDDKDGQFAADLANAHLPIVTKVMSRLAVSEAQLRRTFFEKQLSDSKENLVKAEQTLRAVQEKSGVIVLDKQAEALITGAALVRAQISEREVQLKVLRTSATEHNPDVMRLGSELRALRGELVRMESAQGESTGSAVDLPVGRIPEASIDYVRARRELKLQETLLEGMLRQFEIAKLDEAKEGATLQQVDAAMKPDYKSRPSRALIVLASSLLALLAISAWVVIRRYASVARAADPESDAAWRKVARAWRLRRD